MRIALVAAALLVAGCASPAPETTRSTLASADAATSLLVGPTLTQEIAIASAREGMDPVVTLTLRQPGGRAMRFQEANHAPNDLLAQAPGGPLAQIMGLFGGDEAPVLYYATDVTSPFLCAPEGPVALGIHRGEDGTTQIAALRQGFQFETRPDGRVDAVPCSPDQVCARLRFSGGARQ